MRLLAHQEKNPPPAVESLSGACSAEFMAASLWRTAVETASKNPSYACLPTGPCHFRSLSNGSGAPTCGCRRFWLDQPVNGHDSPERVICFCGHHACFHDAQPDVSSVHGAQYPSMPPTRAQNDIWTVADGDRNIDLPACQQVRQTIHVSNPTHHYTSTEPKEGASARQDVWSGLNAFARWQQDPAWLPSTAPPSAVSDNIKTDPPEQIHNTSLDRPYMPFFPHMEEIIASPTVRATPSIQGSAHNSVRMELEPDPPTARRSFVPTEDVVTGPGAHTQDRDGTELSPDGPKSAPDKARVQQPTTYTDDPLMQDWRNLLQSCMRRLEEMENMSFSHVPIEEVQDKFELLEGRLLDLESWRADIEARLEASELPVDESSVSEMSGSMTNSNSKTDNAHIQSRVAEIEQRLNDLESVHPSYAYPWEIEVVLLPFGRRLNGIWHESTNVEGSDSPRRLDEEDGIDVPAIRTFGEAENQESAWTMNSIQAWASAVRPPLRPKAPGPNNIVFKRLRSRGLVRTISVTDAGAHGIWKTIRETFSDFLGAQPEQPARFCQQPYQGLNQPLVPLRKVRKSSWLRYLSPHELITPATWDMSFLNSGVFMEAKGGVKRLYLTTADAYSRAHDPNWTWPRIRQLSPRARKQSTSSAPGVIPSTESRYEPCWDHVPALDDLPSFDSFVSHESIPTDASRITRVRSADELDGEDFSRKSRISSSSRDTVIIQEAASFPVIARKASHSKRQSSPSCTPIAYQKRRRMSSSLGFRGGPIELTPRWSHEPPTPSLTEKLWDTRSQGLAGTGTGRKRGSTPFAYATPHSHNVASLYLAMADGGDTDPEPVGSEAAESEKEWEGVEDDIDNMNSSRPSSRSSSGSEMLVSDAEFGDDEGYSDGEDGLTIYEA